MLQNFRGRIEGIRHVALRGACPSAARARAGATGNCLVVCERAIADAAFRNIILPLQTSGYSSSLGSLQGCAWESLEIAPEAMCPQCAEMSPRFPRQRLRVDAR